MSQKMKVVLMILAALYVISPIDIMPGPVDDLIMIFLTLAAQKRSGITGKVVKTIEDN